MYYLLLTLSLSYCSVEKNVSGKIFVGSVSTLSNPFWSQTIPGIHYCDKSFDSQHEYSIYYSNTNEKLYKIPFNYSRGDLKGQTYEHCAIRIDDAMLDKIRRVSANDAFIRFYLSNKCVRVRLFKVENNDIYIYSEFKIVIDNNGRNFVVENQRPVKVERGSQVTFKYETEFKNLEGYEKKQMNLRTKYLYITAIIVFIIVIIFIAIYSFNNRILSNLEIPYSELWRLPESHNMNLFFTSLGLLTISVFITIQIFCIPNEFIDKFLKRLILVMSTNYLVFTSILSNVVKNPIGTSQWISPFLVAYSTTTLSFQTINKLFGSDRGYPIFQFLIDNGFYISLGLIFCISVGRSAILLKAPCEIDAKRGQSGIQKKKLAFYYKAFDIIFILISIMIFYPICPDLIKILFGDNEFDFNLITSTFLAYMMISGLFSLIRTITRINKQTSWQEDHITIHSLVSIAICVICFYMIFMNFMNFQSFVMGIALIIPLFLIITSTGVFFSYITSFITVILTYKQPKNN